MNKIRKSLILSMAIMLFAAVGISAATAANSEQTERTLEEQIFKKIVNLPYYGVFDNIGFELDGDTVVLSGKVYNAINRKNAEVVVSRLEGVSKVVNNIELLPPSSFDDRIRRRVINSFARTGGIYRYIQSPRPSMRIIVDGGDITLEGYVSNKSDIKLAYVLARSIPGVFDVTNNLKLVDNMKY